MTMPIMDTQGQWVEDPLKEYVEPGTQLYAQPLPDRAGPDDDSAYSAMARVWPEMAGGWSWDVDTVRDDGDVDAFMYSGTAATEGEAKASALSDLQEMTGLQARHRNE